ncbi:hypothetical protein SAMN06297387_104267 [Streptomyces zhaozhouensis]|uniref:DUF7848 domain-containing protein n=1 Tax=Streptomyces zhaozhouensis TaxID=1300267 RepID=A0A286DTT1_9ACTN|nr:hypothetical protein [Streptomyces zhaozhouensis]SOD62097.1 hypothetical protein SAMN06297387_104267 [Streptomyces zhaozhouensis]
MITPRSVIKAAEWTLSEETAEGAPRAIFGVTCVTCAAESGFVDNEPHPIEMWALRHTSLHTGHRLFRLTTEWFLRVDPAPGNPLHDTEKENAP